MHRDIEIAVVDGARIVTHRFEDGPDRVELEAAVDGMTS